MTSGGTALARDQASADLPCSSVIAIPLPKVPVPSLPLTFFSVATKLS
jgi:hypothetical protein